ncbi:hypothetical protein METH109765_08790 [Mesobacillus thioparans]
MKPAAPLSRKGRRDERICRVLLEYGDSINMEGENIVCRLLSVCLDLLVGIKEHE